jgi:hypothetical protein
MSSTAQQMTADEARDFGHFSVHNAVQAQMACPEGSCEAYSDIFTFRRWRAQGFVVRKGEKGTTVTTWIPQRPKTDNEEQNIKRRPKRAVLFCRHQVERLAGR